MEGTIRREKIIKQILDSETPVSAKKLSGFYNVSRQVIVQDVALLRAAGYDIIATNRGYVLNKREDIDKPSCLVKVFHTEDQLEDELLTVVDLGGEVQSVIINHKVYGRMEAELNISSRRDVSGFIKDIKNGRSSPLMNVTSNYHFHQIKAPDTESLEEITAELKRKGYLIEIMDGQKLWH